MLKKNPRKDMGSLGEKLASRYLRRKGYRIIKTNYRTKIGEIDIIAQAKDTLVFCEVKARKNKQFGEPFEAVTLSKRRKIRRLAEHYLTCVNEGQSEYRFDVVSIILNDKDRVQEIGHIENAF